MDIPWDVETTWNAVAWVAAPGRATFPLINLRLVPTNALANISIVLVFPVRQK
jgi:hypothetical protein